MAYVVLIPVLVLMCAFSSSFAFLWLSSQKSSEGIPYFFALLPKKKNVRLPAFAWPSSSSSGSSASSCEYIIFCMILFCKRFFWGLFGEGKLVLKMESRPGCTLSCGISLKPENLFEFIFLLPFLANVFFFSGV